MPRQEWKRTCFLGCGFKPCCRGNNYWRGGREAKGNRLEICQKRVSGVRIPPPPPCRFKPYLLPKLTNQQTSASVLSHRSLSDEATRENGCCPGRSGRWFADNCGGCGSGSESRGCTVWETATFAYIQTGGSGKQEDIGRVARQPPHILEG